MSKVEEAIIAHWGERCADTEPGCPCCDAWIEYDAIRANAQALVEAATEMSAAFYSNGNVTDRHLRACKAGIKLDAALAAMKEG